MMLVLAEPIPGVDITDVNTKLQYLGWERTTHNGHVAWQHDNVSPRNIKRALDLCGRLVNKDNALLILR